MAKPFKISILVVWFVIINILFCLPGSALPSEDWLDKIWFDKWVHIGIFSVLIYLCNWTFLPDKSQRLKIILGAVAYGILIEFIQKNFIPNRGFDLGDWAADIIGIFIGTLAWDRYKKSKAL